jgi:hypothetical protein
MFRISRSRIEYGRITLAAVLLAAALAGCSEHLSNNLYFDHRETISPLAGDALASNRVTQTVDPWSAPSANNNIAYNGEKMQTASERYRTGRIIPPVNATTSSLSYSQAQQAAQSAASGQAASAPSAAAVK